MFQKSLISILVVNVLFMSIECIPRQRRQTCDSSKDLTQVPTDCSKFYRCANGILSVHDCSPGLVFDNVYKVCNWPNQVATCKVAVSYQAPACTAVNDLTQVETDCSKFYRCANGVLSVQSCPTGLLFDSNLRICNWPNSVMCIQKTTPTCDPALDLTQIPNDCSKYYRCINGQLSTLTCPNGYLFDKNAKTCNPANLVATCNPIPCNSAIDLTPASVNCSQFYRCINGVQSILSCPSGYLFDKNLKTCNPSNQVTCGNCDPNADLTPVPNDCSKFYKCVNGALTTLSCPTGYLFDKLAKTCNPSNQVTCGTCDPAVDLTPVPNDCSKFYRCVNGALSTLTCPNGYLFDKLAKTCNPSNQVTCGNCDPALDLTAVPNDCSKFYRCVNGALSTLTCPNGYLFDKNAKTCNPSNQVTCGTCNPQIDLTPVVGNCSQFYRCINGAQTTLSCPTGYLFDKDAKTCNPANQVNCYSCANKHLTNVPGDCSRYYLCINNVLSTNNCPAGTSFDLSVKNCRTTSLISGKCGTDPFPACSISLSQEARLDLCSQSGFVTDFPDCC